MQKVLVIQGCKECPYKMKVKAGWRCTHDGFYIYRTSHSNAIITKEVLPTAPHPDCKMNDLPSDIWKIIDESTEGVSFPNEQSMADTKTGAMMGANFVIERIKK